MEEVVDGVLVSNANSGTRKRQASGGKRKETKRKRYSAPSAEKKKDVEKLLKLLYGEDWQNEPENAFKWYKTILYDLPDGNDEEEEVCDCLDNDIGLRI
ncbi:hypothetical protein J6590_015963 [Homalodisca vitripennis]|nr:hypothetical protein J6590_015963 [Homalodisca vitripennis]